MPVSSVLMTCVMTLNFARFAPRSESDVHRHADAWRRSRTSAPIVTCTAREIPATDRARDEGACQHEQPPCKCCTKAFLAAPKPQPTDTYFSISLGIIFGDINYKARTNTAPQRRGELFRSDVNPKRTQDSSCQGQDETIPGKDFSHRIELARRIYNWRAWTDQGDRRGELAYANPLIREHWIIDYRIQDPDGDGKTKRGHARSDAAHRIAEEERLLPAMRQSASGQPGRKLFAPARSKQPRCGYAVSDPG